MAKYMMRIQHANRSGDSEAVTHELVFIETRCRN